MNKLILLISFFAMLATYSCKDKPAAAKEESHEGHDHNDAKTTTYKCPMDCEKGKTYTEAGKCPVCKMDLKEVASIDDHEGHEHSKENHEGHDHSKEDDHKGHNH